MRFWGYIAVGLACILAACSENPGNSAGEPVSYFESDEAFQVYLENLPEELREPPSGYGCVDDLCDRIIVTGSRIASPSNPTITNNQEVGVDEGDIVKQIGRFLIVLQDGRLISIDTSPPEGGAMRLVERFNVYRSADDDDWIDEILVSGNQILVTSYSYRFDASSFSLFSLDGDGHFSRGETYYVKSQDYYSSDNYASRIIGNQLVIHVPLDFDEFIYAQEDEEALPWPVIGSWSAWNDPEAGEGEIISSQSLIQTTDILKPLSTEALDTLHLVIRCDIENGMDCSATGVISGGRHEFYVTPEAFYLWSWGGNWWSDFESSEPTGYESDGYCRPGGVLERAPVSQLHRIPHGDETPGAIFAVGGPSDQFSMSENGGRFRALIAWEDEYCPEEYEDGPIAFMDIPLSRFAGIAGRVTRRDIQLMPQPAEGGHDDIVNRFTQSHLAYAISDNWHDNPPEDGEEHDLASMVLVPLGRPSLAHTVMLDHGAIRMERLGEDVLVTGYRGNEGLRMSVIEPGFGGSRLSASTLLSNRYESEGRSHAFNYRHDEGGVLMGIPTVKRDEDAGRWWWNSDSSNLSFVRLTTGERFSTAGDLLTTEIEPDDDYQCEVSCVDWYGNSRPIFTAGRIFALMGTELVEGEISEGMIREMTRIDLTEPFDAEP